MKWPEEVVRWLHDNVPGRTTKQVTELIKQQGFEEKVRNNIHRGQYQGSEK